MGLNDDNYFDDYEIQELIKRFETQLDNGQPIFFDADEMNIIIEYYIQNNDLQKISIIADLAEKFHSGNKITNLILAKKHLAFKSPMKAMEYLQDADAPSFEVDYYLSLGYCYSLMGKPEKSISAYKKTINILNGENCEDIYNSMAIEYMMLRKFEEALSCFKKGIAVCSDFAEQYAEMSECYFNLDKADDAITFFESEVDRNPYSIEAWMALGNCYLRLHLLEKAMEQYEYALAINPRLTNAYTNILTILNELDRYKETIELSEEAIRNKVNSPLLYCLYGEALSKTGNKSDAMSYFKKAIEMDEDVAEAHAGIAFLLSEENNITSAIKFLKKAHELAPFNTDYLFVLAEEHNKIGKYKMSLKYLKEIEGIFPYDVNLYIAFMEVYILLDDVENAIKSINKGLKLLGRNAALLYRMAFIYFVQEEKELGMLNLEEALSLDYEGHREFLEFDPEYILNNEEIVNLINEYKTKNKR